MSTKIEFNQQQITAHNAVEKHCWTQQQLVCGIDEAGRGCLAGPVVAAAAVLPPNTNYDLLRDSKELTTKQRQQAFDWITKNCWFGVALGSVVEIDSINILNSTKLAMRQSFLQILSKLDLQTSILTHVVIDSVALQLPQNPTTQKPFCVIAPNKAESLSASVAAASIVAKVTRDHLLNKFAAIFPGFELKKHKGYGTSQHLQKILHLGPSFIHREKFVTTALKNLEQKQNHGQQSFF